MGSEYFDCDKCGREKPRDEMYNASICKACRSMPVKTLRDEFAVALAPQALKCTGWATDEMIKDASVLAYQMADAMLKQREVKNDK